MHKSNKPIAGYHLLMILSSVDDTFALEEGLLIRDYLKEEFPIHVNLDDEFDVIACMQPEEWKGHFEFHAKCFFDDSTEKEREEFIAFAKTLIKADNEVSDNEHHYYKQLKNMWEIA